jgi:serine/threonine protein phosphatase 1
MGTYVIGDIHGRPHLLDQLIRDLPWDVKSDKIVFLGDLVDRGSDVPGVLDRVMKIAGDNPRVVVLRGTTNRCCSTVSITATCNG